MHVSKNDFGYAYYMFINVYNIRINIHYECHGCYSIKFVQIIYANIHNKSFDEYMQYDITSFVT